MINRNVRTLHKILENFIEWDIKRIIHHDQVEFILRIQSWFNIWKPITINQSSKGQKSHDQLDRCKKHIWQRLTLSRVTNTQPNSHRREYAHLINGMYQTPSVITTLKKFLLIGIRFLLLPLLVNTALEFLRWQLDKEIK